MALIIIQSIWNSLCEISIYFHRCPFLIGPKINVDVDTPTIVSKSA